MLKRVLRVITLCLAVACLSAQGPAPQPPPPSAPVVIGTSWLLVHEAPEGPSYVDSASVAQDKAHTVAVVNMRRFNLPEAKVRAYKLAFKDHGRSHAVLQVTEYSGGKPTSTTKTPFDKLKWRTTRPHSPEAGAYSLVETINEVTWDLEHPTLKA